uniref:Reverse transcriptase domain-containing protein n=1 Tax=Anolis carolinensis TaxID=28377 RepID=A0A803SUT6_ANOCA
MLWMGDFNGVMVPKEDRDSKVKKDRKEGRLPGSFLREIQYWELYDIWRVHNPTRKEYSYYSHRHGTSSRIDLIFGTKELVGKTEKIELLPRVLADHNPILMKLRVGYKRNRAWRMNDYILKIKSHREKIRMGINNYFKDNAKEEMKEGIVWDAGKAVIRGLLIQQNSIWYKGKNKAQLELLSKIRTKELEIEKEKGTKTRLQGELKKLHQQYEQLIASEIERKVMYNRYNFFENANKPGKLLAWQIKDAKKKPLIMRIKNKGETVTDSQQIQKLFEEYYANLYKKTQGEIKTISQYVEETNLEQISEAMKADLDKQITPEEVIRTINMAKVNKSPGADGLSTLYYKTFKEELVPQLVSVMNVVLKKGELPESWKESIIVLVPKQDKDLDLIKNYRPISLLNCDYKIFATILANRIKQALAQIIHKDQVGFLPGRQVNQNIRLILNTLEVAEKDPNRDLALFFIDAEKAFDHVRWDYLEKVLEKFEVGHQFKRAVGAIYSNQRARLNINGQLSDYIDIQKGTRQGCPLSPLLFIMGLEILNVRIREEKEITGLKISDQELKIRAYADDIVCILTNPLQSIKKVLDIIQRHGDISGFIINKEKSKFLVKNIDAKSCKKLEAAADCEVIPKVKYLGIWVTNKNINLFQDNYVKVWEDIKKDLTRWQTIPLTWMGRIAVIKMMVLPKMLFLFQNIPIIKGINFFEKLKRKITDFIWAGKRARIAYRNLIDDKGRGGLSLPDLRTYYEAAALSWMKEWIKLENKTLLNLEGYELRFGWHAYVWYDGDKLNKDFNKHIIRGGLLDIWKKYRKGMEPKTPLWLRPLEAVIRPALSVETRTYKEYLIRENEEWKLKGREELEINDWFRYHQLHERYKKDMRVGFATKKSELERIWEKGNKGLISRLYKYILSYNMEDNTVKTVMISWAKDLGRPIELDNWEYLWNKEFKFTISGSIRENQYKMFYRCYITPATLAKIDKSQQGICWRCRKQKGTFIHMWWTCMTIQAFWDKVIKETNKMLHNKIKKSPGLCLLGLHRENNNQKDQEIYQYSFAAARLTIAKDWKGEKGLTKKDWRERMREYMLMAKLTNNRKNKSNEDFLETWKLAIAYLNKESVT